MKSRKLLVTQSNYIPWKGFFDGINAADHLIIFDDVQFTKRDWRNRNIIKTPGGNIWLTIPVEVKGKFAQKIRETKVVSLDWAANHWETIRHAYRRAPYFKHYESFFADLYLGCQEVTLSGINHRFLKAICDLLGIKTTFSFSWDYEIIEGQTDRIVSLCQQEKATEYLSGPSARAYLEMEKFEQNDIKVHFFDYAGYLEYPQLYPPFVHEVSIIDLIFSVGPDAPSFVFKISGRKNG